MALQESRRIKKANSQYVDKLEELGKSELAVQVKDTADLMNRLKDVFPLAGAANPASSEMWTAVVNFNTTVSAKRFRLPRFVYDKLLKAIADECIVGKDCHKLSMTLRSKLRSVDLNELGAAMVPDLGLLRLGSDASKFDREAAGNQQAEYATRFFKPYFKTSYNPDSLELLYKDVVSVFDEHVEDPSSVCAPHPPHLTE